MFGRERDIFLLREIEENERKYRIEIYIENMKLDGSRDVEL